MRTERELFLDGSQTSPTFIHADEEVIIITILSVMCMQICRVLEYSSPCKQLNCLGEA